MSQVHVIRDSFNAGELSPLLGSRFAVEKVASGCRRLRNFIPHVHGPAFRRPGMEYLGPGMGDGARSSLRAFTFSTTTGAVLELHSKGLKVWSSDGMAVPLKAPVPPPGWTAGWYTDAECAEVQIAQVNDTCYLVHPERPPFKLKREEDDEWTLSEIEWKWPALGDENVNPDKLPAEDTEELLTAPMHNWPDFLVTKGSYKIKLVGLESATPGTGDAPVWKHLQTFAWTTAVPPEFTGTLGKRTRIQMRYEAGPKHVTDGVKVVVTWDREKVTDDGSAEIRLDRKQPESRQPFTVEKGWKWAIAFDKPSGNGPAGSYLTVQRIIKSKVQELAKISSTRVKPWPGPVFRSHAEIRLIWHGYAVKNGTLKAYRIVPPDVGNITIEQDENLTVPGTVGVPAAPGKKGEVIRLKSSDPIFQKLHEGSYWQITHRRDVAHIERVGVPETDPDADALAALPTLLVAGKWDVFSYGTWSATLTLQKKVDGKWEMVRSWQAKKDRNIIASGTEDDPVEMRLVVSGGSEWNHPTGVPDADPYRPRFVLEAADARVNGLVLITEVDVAGDGFVKLATAKVITGLHSTAATSLWTEGAWSRLRGFPRTVAIHGQRLWFGGTRTEPQRVWGSVVNDFDDMRRSTFEDAGVSFTPGAQTANPIEWMLGHGKELIIGTAGHEFTLGSEGPIVTPTDVSIQPRSAYGSARLPGVMLGDGVAFVQRGGRKLRLVAPRADGIAWKASDLTVLADHITRKGIVQTAVMTHPFTILWVVTGDGKLLGMTFEPDQNVFGWHVHETDGTVESVAVLARPDGDQVWVAVNRKTRRGIERLDSNVFAQDFTQPGELIYLDAARRFAPPHPPKGSDTATVFTGLSHLNGRVVTILADGAEAGTVMVSGGRVRLETEARRVIIGLPFTSELQPMRMELPLQDGTAQHRNWRVSRVGLFVHESLGGEVADAPDGRFEKLQYRRAATPTDAPPPLHSGEIETPLESRTRSGADVIVRTNAPLPFNVGALTLKFDVYGE